MPQAATSNISNAAAATEPVAAPRRRNILAEAPLDILAGALSTYFVLAAFSLYWLTAAGGWLVSKALPRSMMERAPLTWLIVSAFVVSVATQTVPGFFPDYGAPREIAAEIALWVALGMFARAYLIYTDYPPTFDGLKSSIESRPLERLVSRHLHNPIDAIFTRIWVGNSVALIPLTALLIFPTTVNYFVIVALSTAMLLSQFPHEIIDHTNIHTRVFQPRLGSSSRVKAMLRGLQLYFENVLSMLVARTPHFYFAQHVFIHHFEGNGPRDSQTTEPYDRTSFLDFARHAFRQGVHLVTGVAVIRYLWSKDRRKPARDLIVGLLAWWAIVVLVAQFNPIAAAFLFVSRFLGGNVQSLVAFWQHGLVVPADSARTYSNTIDFEGPEHGNLGNDYHVEHHDQPGRHWSKYYELFTRQTQQPGGHDAVVFHKDVFSPLAFVAALWKRDHATIGAMAHIHGLDTSDKATMTAQIRARTAPIGIDPRSGIPDRIDRTWSYLMGLAMPARFKV